MKKSIIGIQKTKKVVSFFLVLVSCFCLFGGMIQAKTPYDTYTYSYEGDAQISPSAYIPVEEQMNFGEAGTLNKPSDIIVDKFQRILIADKDNNRIVVLDANYQLLKVLQTYIDEKGEEQSFNKPQGVYSTPEGLLYVADTENARIVVFDQEFRYVRTIEQPSANILPEGFVYRPAAIAVDWAGRIYVVSLNTNMGVIALDKDGRFEGFIGAQRVKVNLLDLFWRKFMTEEQLARMSSFVPVVYSNLTIDEKGFVYVTSSQIDRYTLYQSIVSRSTDSSYAPIKKINPSGTDVLRRNGFFPPVGDINFDAYSQGSGAKKAVDPSSITEVSLLKNGMYSLVDSAYSKIFTYDSFGNLLYAFGGEGEALGLFNQMSSVAYNGDHLLALDSGDGSLTVFNKTEYARKIDQVIGYQENREYDKAIASWTDIIGLNNNFDMAYLGIGKTKLEQGDYQSAMEHFRLINNQTYYSKAFKLYRENWLKSYGLFVLAGVVVVIMLIAKFFSFAKKYNLAHAGSREEHGVRDQLMYGARVIFHPFDGFWDMKHEKRAGVGGATIILFVTLLSFIVKDFGSGYLSGNVSSGGSMLSTMANLFIPFFLWCIANWCLTSLMDGKGTFKDIYIATSYALIPLIFTVIPVALISNFVTLEEVGLLNFALNVGIFWAAVLLIFGTMVTHDYTPGKNIFVLILTVVGIAIILFLIMTFFSVTGRLFTMINNVITEIMFRV